MSMNQKHFTALKHYLDTGKTLDCSMVTDQWIEDQLKACVGEIEALSTQLDSVYEILNDTSEVELASKRVCRAWQKKAALEPHIENLLEALKTMNGKVVPEKTDSLPNES
jgi:hypothetical protein